MAGLNRKAVAELEKIAIAIGIASAELVVEIKLVVVDVVLLTEAGVSELVTGEVEAGSAVAKVVGVAAGERIVVVGRMACSADRDSGIVAVVRLPASVVLAVIAAELMRTDYILVGSDTLVVDAGVVGATVADIAAAGKDIAVDVAAVVVVAAAADAVADSGNLGIAARTASGMACSAAAAVRMVALAAVLLCWSSFAPEDIWMLE